MKPGFFHPDIVEFVALLERHEVRYLVVGGVAVTYHGYARLTGDVDFYYDAMPDNVERLWAALVEFWSGRVPGVQDSEELLEPGVIVQFGRPPNRIDLISSVGSVSFDDAWERQEIMSIARDDGPVSLRIIGLSDLLQSKRDAGRPRDLDDLAHLEPDEPTD